MRPIFKTGLVACCLLASPFALLAQKATVHVTPPNLHGPRELKDQTASAAVRDYLESWTSMQVALSRNRVALLDPYFVGSARDKLAATIHDQTALGIHTRYHALRHNLQIVFYSPEGLSIQLVDNVQYDEQVFDHGKALTTERLQARYLVVLTPAETRWRVRIFQAEHE
jgi:hypothetical protein